MAALKRIPNAAAAEAAAAIAANNTTTIYAKRNTTNLINNINTTTMTKTTNTTLLSNNSSSRKLLMKNQLHLNLNVIEPLNVDNDDNELNSTMEALGEAEGSFGIEQPPLKKLERDGVNVETVTTVPQQQQPHGQKQQYSNFEEISVGQSSTVASAATVRRMAAATSLSSSPSALLNSSLTALAKFNRIIDSTMPETNYYLHEQTQQQQQQRGQFQCGIKKTMHADDATLPTAVLSEALQQRLALVYPDIVSADSQSKKINFTTTKTVAAATVVAGVAKANYAAKSKAKVKGKSVASHERLRSKQTETTDTAAQDEASTAAATAAPSNDDNQMKRNDVHYLLKQLNSFSDIEEIEIVDMEQRQRQLDEQQQRLSTLQQQQLAQQLAQEQQQQQHIGGHGGGGGGMDNKSQSPTAQSLVIISPSSLSHKGIRRYASLHQQEYSTHHYYTLDSDEALDNFEQQQQYLLQQFDDYLFQSCHYLETNSFAANYRTAMVESSSHEFRPSMTTPSTTATTTRTGTSGAASVSSEQSLELHEIEPPSVICKATPPLPPEPEHPATVTTPPQQPTVGISLAPTSVTLPPTPPKRFGMQARLTISGIQTELTATTALNMEPSLSKSTSSSASSSEDQRRRAPFFKCCYTPIDRWREKRSAAHTAAATQKHSDRHSAAKQSESEVGLAASSVSGRERRGSSVAGGVPQQLTRKNGHAV
ncbi:ras-interacting protein RIP3-like [Eurosta solidaginis]|uniref:ras-interacting protein RIP3-like n=1 Tax=Eurosta solidaginis TaxID=178769 RepID=UPI003530D7B4